jgi:tRNA-2-methylthio-N6-dimethylallyladenosine synthase
MKPNKCFYIETLGCQMNKLDSELVAGLLARLDFHETPDPGQADVAILNTCSVRDHAEQKALSRLGHFNHLRRRHGKPAVIAIIGCFAQRDPDHIRQKAPFVDIICGPNQIHQLGDLIQTAYQARNLHQKHPPHLAVEDFRKIRSGKSESPEELENLDLARPMGENQYQRFVRVQRGCDNFCTYCVVPYVRGPEVSRPAEHILEEVRRIGQTGCQEITLIGQTINSYRDVANGQTVDLPELLYRVHAACDIPRIRFITSYPAEFSIDLFYAMREMPRICPYLHLPAQHGSNPVLAAMNRKYTVEEYLDILDQGRKIVPNLSVAGDFIVGFPTETDADHEQSVALLEKVRYKNCFIFKYSPRPGTLAEKKYAEEVPPDVVAARHSQMLKTQDRISEADNQTLVGQEVLALVEGPSKKNRAKEGHLKQLVGRTGEDKIVIFDGPESAVGKIQKITVTSASALTLFGTV